MKPLASIKLIKVREMLIKLLYKAMCDYERQGFDADFLNKIAEMSEQLERLNEAINARYHPSLSPIPEEKYSISPI